MIGQVFEYLSLCCAATGEQAGISFKIEDLQACTRCCLLFALGQNDIGKDDITVGNISCVDTLEKTKTVLRRAAQTRITDKGWLLLELRQQ